MSISDTPIPPLSQRACVRVRAASQPSTERASRAGHGDLAAQGRAIPASASALGAVADGVSGLLSVVAGEARSSPSSLHIIGDRPQHGTGFCPSPLSSARGERRGGRWSGSWPRLSVRTGPTGRCVVSLRAHCLRSVQLEVLAVSHFQRRPFVGESDDADHVISRGNCMDGGLG